MKITDIKQQVKRQDRYSIYVDEKYIFSLSENELLNLGLKIGQEFTKDELEGLKVTAILDKAYDRALNLIARRLRSEWEIRDYLRRKDYTPALIDTIVNKLSMSGYVDDAKFAEAWIRNRRLLKPTSKRRLVQELRAKRVPDDVIDQVLESDEADELDILRQLVEKKRHRYPDKLKFMQYLARQGYNYDDIKTVLDEQAEQ
jgi:regulatory protein